MPITTEQLAARKIGGSDVACILGLNPYKTPIELYAEKRGEIEPEDLSENEAVEAGNVMEDAIAELTARRMSRREGREIKLRRCNLTLTHPKYPWLTVHIDRDVVGEDRGVELKNVGWRAAPEWGQEGTDEIPDYYLPQPHTYMLVKDYPLWNVSAYLGGRELRLYTIERSREMEQLIVEETHDFWHNHVLAGVPPPFNVNHRAAAKAIKRLYPGTDGSQLNADASLDHWKEVMQEAAELRLQYEKSEELAKLHLARAMGEAATLLFLDGSRMERKQVTRKGYTVEPTSYMDVRFKKPAKEK